MEEVLQQFKQKVAGPMLPRDKDTEMVMSPAPKATEQITMKFEDVDFDADSFGAFEPPPKT